MTQYYNTQHACMHGCNVCSIKAGLHIANDWDLLTYTDQQLGLARVIARARARVRVRD